jgi:hypothetical protein
MRLMTGFVAVIVVGATACLTACEKKAPAPAPKAAAPKASGHDHEHEGHGHAHVITLGEATSGAYTVKATRDEGEIKAGGDAPIDVTITGAPVKAVRFWIGTEDAAASVKARAEVENAAEPNRWHTHAEIPDPLPAGSKLWVEIEGDSGAPTVVSFDLKQ